MTLVVAWVRKFGKAQELVVASDSRVTGGILVNHCPKLFPLERNDSVIAYCGHTAVAYPIILQIKASLDAHGETRDRIKDITELPAHIERTIENLRADIEDLPCGDGTNLNFKFLLAGYSWRFNDFRVWVFRYDTQSRSFNAHPMPRGRFPFMFMSDVVENERAAKKLLMRFLDAKRPDHRRMNWEPLEVLISTIRDESIGDIGGPPQIIKIYKHANTLPINVLWPQLRNEGGSISLLHRITHLGRPLLEYEQTRFLTIDLVSWDFVEPWNIRKRACQRDEEDLRGRLLVRLVNALSRIRNVKNLSETIQLIINNGGQFEEIKPYLSVPAQAIRPN